MQNEKTYQDDAPKHLLYCSWQCLSRVGSFRCGETDNLCTSIGKRGRHEDAAKSLEAIIESTWAMPISPTNIITRWGASAIDDDSENTFILRKLLANRFHLFLGLGGVY